MNKGQVLPRLLWLRASPRGDVMSIISRIVTGSKRSARPITVQLLVLGSLVVMVCDRSGLKRLVACPESPEPIRPPAPRRP